MEILNHRIYQRIVCHSREQTDTACLYALRVSRCDNTCRAEMEPEMLSPDWG